MFNVTKPAVLALAVFASAVSLGTSPARADLCDGSWRTVGTRQMQCYSLPTLSNGRVTGLSFHRNFRPLPGPVVVPHGWRHY